MPKPPLSDDAVRRATEKSWDEWVAWLDARGGRALDHKGIVGLLADAIESGWWRQMVAGGYERIALGRKPNEMPDGFQVQASKTIDAPPDRVWKELDAKRLPEWSPGGEVAVSSERKNKSLRGEWSGGEAHPAARFGASLTAKPNGKTQLVIQLNKIPDAEAAELAKRAWREALSTLKGRVEGK